MTRGLFVYLCAAVLVTAAAPPETTTDRLAKLASALTAGNASLAMESFDKSLKQYWDLERNIEALTAQSDILCAIDVVEETDGPGGLRVLDTDWVVQLKSKAELGGSENRRERVRMEMRLVKGKWKITAMNQVKMLAAMRVE